MRIVLAWAACLVGLTALGGCMLGKQTVEEPAFHQRMFAGGVHGLSNALYTNQLDKLPTESEIINALGAGGYKMCASSDAAFWRLVGSKVLYLELALTNPAWEPELFLTRDKNAPEVESRLKEFRESLVAGGVKQVAFIDAKKPFGYDGHILYVFVDGQLWEYYLCCNRGMIRVLLHYLNEQPDREHLYVIHDGPCRSIIIQEGYDHGVWPGQRYQVIRDGAKIAVLQAGSVSIDSCSAGVLEGETDLRTGDHIIRID